MEIYNRKDFVGKKLYDYISEKSPITDGIMPIAISDKKLSAGDIITTQNSAYRIEYIFARVSQNPENKYWAVAKKLPDNNAFTTNNAGKIENTKNPVCPFCGYEDSDSWKLKELEGVCICPNCRSTFLYKKKITVTYTTEPVSKTNIREL